MKNPLLLDLYTDYCITSFKSITATGLSQLVEQQYSHDQISRFLSSTTWTQKDFWQLVKPLLRAVEQADGILSIDDTIAKKPHSTTNDLICYHWDHAQNRSVKGINILNFVYHAAVTDGEVTLPVAFECIQKTTPYYDQKKKQVKKRSPVTKNELVRERLYTLTKHNQLAYRYVVWDTWFSSKANLAFVQHTLKKQFVVALKKNRKLALSAKDQQQGRYIRVEDIDFQSVPCQQVWLKGLDFPVVVAKQVFTNKDGSTGELFLISNDLELTATDLFIIYHKRWGIEVFHKSVKQNTGLEKSPTKYEVTQQNHIFASTIAYCKLEVLKVKEGTNHFALKAKLYLKALQAAFQELQVLKQRQPVQLETTTNNMFLLAEL